MQPLKGAPGKSRLSEMALLVGGSAIDALLDFWYKWHLAVVGMFESSL